MKSAEELRAASRRLRQTLKTITDPALKQEQAARALELAERAEAIADASEDPEILRANIRRYRRMLSADDGKNKAQTRIIQETLSDAGEMLEHELENAAC